jgi:hypothetical protein
MTYLAYHFSDYNEGKNLPLAAAETEDAARTLGIRTILTLGWTDGTLQIVRNDDITTEEVDAINEAVAGYLARSGEA